MATCQVRALERNGAGREREVTSLRQQLVDLQAESDEKTVIGECQVRALERNGAGGDVTQTAAGRPAG